MRIPKRYGQSHVDRCPFCESIAVTESIDGVPVCAKHKEAKMPELRCACGEYLDLMKGKFGSYFRCMRCGNISFRKAMEMNPGLESSPKEKKQAANETKKEITVRSDELDFI